MVWRIDAGDYNGSIDIADVRTQAWPGHAKPIDNITTFC
ncbi:hypothetical protein MNO11_16030 [Serratia plymuthica]|nr:hypothetical protein [Serratia plymuthica]UNK30675.1 hypothetical protein MNO11_16030 [Serratia plymuthica]